MPYKLHPILGIPVYTYPPGGGGGGQTWKVDCIPLQPPDGSRVIFNLPGSDTFIAGSLVGILNGQVLTKGNDYSETGNNRITFQVPPLTDDIIRLMYRTT